MTDSETHIDDVSQLHPGDRVEIHASSHVGCRGQVEEVMPALHVVWIREHGTGQRRMFTTDDHRIHRN